MPPNDHVVDTNVLLVASAADPGSSFKDAEHVPVAEQRKVFAWLRAFRNDKSRCMVLDVQGSILKEYKKKLDKNDYGRQVLVEKYSTALRLCSIELDEAEEARLPQPLQEQIKDRADRKFVAVALADEGESTIVNACDTDWYECEQALLDSGVEVTQIIDDWCRALHARKNSK